MEINPTRVLVQDELADLANRLNQLSVQRPGHMHHDYAHFIRLPDTSNELRILDYAGHGGKPNRTRNPAPRPDPSTQSQSQNSNINDQNQPQRGDQNPGGGDDGNGEDSDGEDRRRRGPLTQVAEHSLHSLPQLKSFLDRVLQPTDPEISRDIRWLRIDSGDNFKLLCHLVSLKRLQHPYKAVLERAVRNRDEGTRRKQVMLRYYSQITAGKPLEYADSFIALLSDVEVREGFLARFLDQHKRSNLPGTAGAQAAADFQRDIQKRFDSLCSMKNDEFFWWAERAIMRVLSQFDTHIGNGQEPQDPRLVSGTEERLVGIVESIYTQAWAQCSMLYSGSQPRLEEVFKHVRSFIRQSLTEDDRTKRSTDLAVVVQCFVGKVALDVATCICDDLKTGGATKSPTKNLKIPHILRHSRAGPLLKDTYKIWHVSQVTSDLTFQSASLIEADQGPLAFQGAEASASASQPAIDLDSLTRACAAVHKHLQPTNLPLALFFSAAFPEPGKPRLLVFKGQWLTKVVSISPQEMKDMGWDGPRPVADVPQGYVRFSASRLEGGVPILVSMEEHVLGAVTPANKYLSWEDVVKAGGDE
ncbi:predicted protein [Chaetomium globosum CBS 148.51]|uniref:Uncharacterized protein n=1 Tax=Chaetomium globosum (strain ATCC 6205 / CBS 148.51 / DSM 1962 / NBRC 6347 / NRRL 1970) TaxID=306901 RepID=Q2GVU8_CHAGB|nr:uncharacterized protein CHGG_07906 [Chaetomium globosum CBS 148.51]EAQ86653.1 predicted protein [Chaetomium globosum CBS 148.51]